MAEKLSVISLSYQMVEGLINNFKSNNWRAGQIPHTRMHTLLASYMQKSCASTNAYHPQPLINSHGVKFKQKSGHCTPRVFMYSIFLLVMKAAPRAPQTVCEGDSWSGGEVLRRGLGLLDCKSHPADWILLASWGQ